MPDLADVGSWPQAIVALGLIVALGVLPSVLALVTARRTHATSRRVEATLTTNNGGSHVKDALDRIERNVKDAVNEAHAVRIELHRHERDAEARLSALEQARRQQRKRGRWRR